MSIIDRIRIYLFGYPPVYVETTRIDKLEYRLKVLESIVDDLLKSNPNSKVEESVDVFAPIPGYTSLAVMKKAYEKRSLERFRELRGKEKS